MKITKKVATATLLSCVMITPVANGLVYTHAQTVINNGDHSNQIAIVNEDKGVVNAKGETVRYSDQFLPSYNKDGYIVTSLDEARNGGYLAYVVVPSSFSSNVESINTQPTQSVLGYYIVDEAHANEATMKVVQLEMNLNRDIGKLYVGSVLSEFFQAQDNAEIVLNNSNINSEAISQLANTDFIRTIDLKPLGLPEAPDGSGLSKVKDTYMKPYEDAINGVINEYETGVVGSFNDAKGVVQTFYDKDVLGNITEAQQIGNDVDNYKNLVKINFHGYTIYAEDKSVNIEPVSDGYDVTMSNKGDVISADKFQILDSKGKALDGSLPQYNWDKKSYVRITWDDNDKQIKPEYPNDVSSRTSESVASNDSKEKIQKYLNSDNEIKEANEHILLQNSINYLDLLYFDVISEFVTDIITDPSLATQSHFNQLMQIRFNNYGNNISVAINQFNQYSDIKINNIQDYINLRTGQYLKVAANYDFANHNLDAISTTIMSMFDTAENTYNSANESVDLKGVDSGTDATYTAESNSSSSGTGIGEKYNSWCNDLKTAIIRAGGSVNDYHSGVEDKLNVESGALSKKNDYLNISKLNATFLPVNEFVQALKENNTDVISVAGKVNGENAKLIADYQTQTNNDLQARVENLENVNNATRANNKDLIGDFSTKLRYSRTGNVPNKTVVDAMMAPLSVTNDGDVKGSVTVPTVKKQDEEEVQKSNVNPWVIGLGISTAVLASYIVGDAVFSRKKHK